jgi:iron complex transport system permease protein
MSADKLSIHQQTVDPQWPVDEKPAEARPVIRPAPDAGRRPARALRTLLFLSLASVAGVVVCLQFGAQPITLADFGNTMRQAMTQDEWTIKTIGATGVILLHVRLPRVLLGFLVGASLAGVGVTLQALMRNPLADPYVLGVSSGAALGASLAVLLGLGTSILALTALPLCGFVGGLISLAIIYGMAANRGQVSVHSLLLAGVILNAIFSALIMFVTSIMEPNRSFGMMAWLMGSLTANASPGLSVLALYLLGGLLLLLREARRLNVIALGEDVADTLGVPTKRLTRRLFVLTALVTGAVVSVSGMIGFVGMVVPHAVRLVAGGDNRLLLPASMLTGGLFLVIADTIARTLLAPTEMPVGIVTALAGGPVFIYLLMSWNRSSAWR